MAAPKDRRLYARLDIGFDEHDKIYPLSDAAFRALVEATLYARRQLTDGFLAERLAVKRWGAEVLEELSTNDPQRPSLVRTEGGWLIHDFAEHQTTNADIDAKREAGAKGAAKRWDRSPMGNPLPNHGGTLAKTETETEIKTLSNAVASDDAPKNIYPNDFEEWWKTYPRREQKGDALKAWVQLKKDRRLPDTETLTTASARYARIHTERKFQKLPAGWLRAHAWEDEAQVAAPETQFNPVRPDAPAGKRYAVDVASGVYK